VPPPPPRRHRPPIAPSPPSPSPPPPPPPPSPFAPGADATVVVKMQLTLGGDTVGEVGEEGSDERTSWLVLLRSELAVNLRISSDRIVINTVVPRPPDKVAVEVDLLDTRQSRRAVPTQLSGEQCLQQLQSETTSCASNSSSSSLCVLHVGALELWSADDLTALPVSPHQKAHASGGGGGAAGWVVFILLLIACFGGLGFYYHKHGKFPDMPALPSFTRSRTSPSGFQNMRYAANAPMPTFGGGGSSTRAGMTAGSVMAPPGSLASADSAATNYTPPAIPIAEPLGAPLQVATAFPAGGSSAA